MTRPAQSDYKLSRYAIASDPFFTASNETAQRVLFSTRSGSLLLVTEAVYERAKGSDLQALPKALFDRLLAAQLLVPRSENELASVIGENKKAIALSSSLYQVIQPTAHCQLGCGYCGQLHRSRLMQPKHQDDLIEGLRAKLKTGKYRELSIAWFGGEPLSGLAAMRALSPRLRQLAADAGCSYKAKIVTNGLALTEDIAVELVETHGIYSAEITLDGPAEYHDRRRHTKAGNKTFSRIFGNLLAIARRPNLPLRLVVRCNVDRSNADGVSTLIDTLCEEKLQSRVEFYVSPIHDWGNSASEASLSKAKFAEQELEWLAQLIVKGFNIGLLPGRRSIVCIAVDPNSELVDAFGERFNCSEVSYVPAYGRPNLYSLSAPPPAGQAGSSQPEGATTPALAMRRFNDDILDGTQASCANCPMLPVCGGACPKAWREGQVPCPSAKYNIKGRLKLLYAARLMPPVSESAAAVDHHS